MTVCVGATLVALAAGCGDSGVGGTNNVTGRVAVDGSQALEPFNLKAQKSFYDLTADEHSSVGFSSDSSALRRLCSGEIDVAAVTRQIDAQTEGRLCAQHGITYHRILVGYQAAIVVANRSLGIRCLTTSQLSGLWRSGSKVSNYSELGSGLPNSSVSLYGPTTSSSVFDLFTSRINGRAGDSRRDYRPFVYPKGPQFIGAVGADRAGLGYFDYAWIENQPGYVSAVAVDSGKGCVGASLQTIRDGSYSPLARPFYYYFDVKQLVRNRHAKVPSTAVATFLQVALSNEAAFAAHNFVIPLTAVEITNERISWLKAVRAYERQKQLSAGSAN